MSHPDHVSRDADLAARISRGDEHAFRQLFERYYEPLCRFAATLVGGRDSAEDLVQALFAKLWEQRARWEVRGSIRGYLYQAVHRRAANQWRAGQVRRRHAESELQSTTSPVSLPAESWPDRLAEEADIQAAYERTIATLTPRVRQAFDLHCRHAFTYREIGEIMGISPRTVESHVLRALVVFRQALAAYLAVTLVVAGR